MRLAVPSPICSVWHAKRTSVACYWCQKGRQRLIPRSMRKAKTMSVQHSDDNETKAGWCCSWFAGNDMV